MKWEQSPYRSIDACLAHRIADLVEAFHNVSRRIEPLNGGHLMAVNEHAAVMRRLRPGTAGELRAQLGAQCCIDRVERQRATVEAERDASAVWLRMNCASRRPCSPEVWLNGRTEFHADPKLTYGTFQSMTHKSGTQLCDKVMLKPLIWNEFFPTR